VVTAALAINAGFPRKKILSYWAAQIAGAVLGVIAAHLMFDLPLLQASQKARFGVGHWFSEVIATFGLVFLVLSLDPKRPWAAPAAVGAYIAAAYWFTASTSFANPAVTIARAMTDTFAGIAPAHVLPFIAAQAVGGALAVLADRALPPGTEPARRSGN
jgi:glycerol uptake facilitator-like aquaporin